MTTGSPLKKKSIDGWKYVVVGSAAAGVGGWLAERRLRTFSCATMAGRLRPIVPNGAPPVPRAAAGPIRAALPAMCSASRLVFTR